MGDNSDGARDRRAMTLDEIEKTFCNRGFMGQEEAVLAVQLIPKLLLKVKACLDMGLEIQPNSALHRYLRNAYDRLEDRP